MKNIDTILTARFMAMYCLSPFQQFPRLRFSNASFRSAQFMVHAGVS